MPHLCSLSLNADPWTSFIRVCHIQCRGARGAPGAAQREPRMRRNQPSGLVRDVSGPHPCPRPPCQPGRAGCPPGGALYPSLEAQKRRGRGGEEPPWTVRMKAPIGPRACSPCLCPGPAHWRPQAPAGEDSPLQPALQLPAPCLVRSWAKRFTLPTLRLSSRGTWGRAPPLSPFHGERGRVHLLRLHGVMLRRRAYPRGSGDCVSVFSAGRGSCQRQVTVEQQPGMLLGPETRSGADRGKGCGGVGGPAFGLSVRCTARMAEPVVLGG